MPTTLKTLFAGIDRDRISLSMLCQLTHHRAGFVKQMFANGELPDPLPSLNPSRLVWSRDTLLRWAELGCPNNSDFRRLTADVDNHAMAGCV